METWFYMAFYMVFNGEHRTLTENYGIALYNFAANCASLLRNPKKMRNFAADMV